MKVTFLMAVLKFSFYDILEPVLMNPDWFSPGPDPTLLGHFEFGSGPGSQIKAS
jgi:hypothetical protein